MTWLTLGGCAVALLALVAGASWLVGRRRDRRIGSPEAVADAADESLAGFVTVDVVVGANGRGALAVASDGRVVAARLRGAAIAVHEVAWNAIRSTADGILIETGERRFGRVLLTGVDVLDIRRLAPVREHRRLAAG